MKNKKQIFLENRGLHDECFAMAIAMVTESATNGKAEQKGGMKKEVEEDELANNF